MCDWSGSCCTMSKQLKGGYLLRYKKKIFGKTWKEEWVVLYDNSSLVWYKDRDRPSPEGGMLLKEAPELLAVGLWTLRIPTRPDLPDGCHTRQLMAFGTPGKEKVHWFLCKSEDEVNEWMTAISNTLPPPPTMPKSEDVISTPSRLKKTEILSHIAHHKSADLISSSCLLDYHLPKTTSLGNGLMNSYHALKSNGSIGSGMGKTGSMTSIYSQRPLASSKTANGLMNGHGGSHHANGSAGGVHAAHGSSSTLSSMGGDKVNGVSSSGVNGVKSVNNAHADDITSALTMSTALGYWSHGFGWGWGPGWGWSGWGVNSMSSLSNDYSSHFRSGYYDQFSYGCSGTDGSNGYHSLDSAGASSGFNGDFAENIDMGIGASGLDDSLLDSAGSAFDAFGGDFGF